MVRTAEALRVSGQVDAAEPIAFRPQLDIETLMVEMASRLVGVPIRHVEPASDAPSGDLFVPPPAPKHFESVEAPDLTSPNRTFEDVGVEALLQTLLQAVGPGPRSRSGGPRPIVLAAPPDRSMDAGASLLEILAAATLALDAAWALEPMADAFVATARWVRPTILVAPVRALDALAEVWDESDRRWSRLDAVVVASDDRGVPEGRIEHWGKIFGCRTAAWKSL